MPSCQDLTLDAQGYTELVAADGVSERRWTSHDGDTLILRHLDGDSLFDGCESPQAVAEGVETLAAADGGDWVEVKLPLLGGRPVVEAVLKHAQAPAGTTYTALLHVPFDGFAFELRVRCPERGEPGQRENALLQQRIASGVGFTFGAGGRIELEDWDPESDAHDASFPDHPLTRARRALKALRGGLRFGPALERLTSASLPERR